ncbi:MAG: SAM-dependent methyltransferase [Advenella sp.]
MSAHYSNQNASLYLVSMGIGDSDNITVRALKTVAKADVIFAMPRVRENFPELLKGKEIHDSGHGLFTPMARRKQAADEVDAMEAKARSIIREAVNAGKTVAVLDYGDPLVYGPQVGYLKEFRDLNPVVIPGVSSFNAANAALGLGVTNGPRNESVILTAAKTTREGYQGTDPLVKLAESQSTLVFFSMNLELPEVVRQLMQYYPADTPVAVVLHAGVAEKQSVLQATLDTVVEKTEGGRLPFEHMIYVGAFLGVAD